MHLLIWLSCTANKDIEPPLELNLDPLCNPLALGEDCLLPFPSISQTLPADTATGVRLNYETSMLRSPGELSFDLSMLNIADGSSRLSPALVNFGRDVAAEFLSGWGEQEETMQKESDLCPFQDLLDAQGGLIFLDGGLATALEDAGEDLSCGPLWSARLISDNPGAIEAAGSHA